MKKLLLSIVVLLLLSAQMYSTEIDSVNVQKIEEVERIVDKYSGKAIEGFQNVVESVSPSIIEGFSMVVKLQVAKGIVMLLPIVFFFIFLMLFIKEYTRVTNILSVPREERVDHYDYFKGAMDEENLSPMLIAYLILGMITGVLMFITTYGGFLHLVAPEWYAVKEIINLFK